MFKYHWIVAAMFPVFYVCWAQCDVGMFAYAGGIWAYVVATVVLAKKDL